MKVADGNDYDDYDEYVEYLAQYLADNVELYGQQGEGVRPSEYFYRLVKEFQEALQ